MKKILFSIIILFIIFSFNKVYAQCYANNGMCYSSSNLNDWYLCGEVDGVVYCSAVIDHAA